MMGNKFVGAFLGGRAIVIQAKPEDISNMFVAAQQQRIYVWIIGKGMIFRLTSACLLILLQRPKLHVPM